MERPVAAGTEVVVAGTAALWGSDFRAATEEERAGASVVGMVVDLAEGKAVGTEVVTQVVPPAGEVKGAALMGEAEQMAAVSVAVPLVVGQVEVNWAVVVMA